MTPKKKTRTTHEAGTSSQAFQRAPQKSRTSTAGRKRGNISHPLVLTNHQHIARYNALSSKLVVATGYYDKDGLNCFGLLDLYSWLFP